MTATQAMVLPLVVVACSSSDVVATVNGERILRRDVEFGPQEMEQIRQSAQHTDDMEKWIHAEQERKLRRKIRETLERQSARRILAEVTPAEVEKELAAFDEYVTSTEPGMTLELFGQRANALQKALNRLREHPDQADKIYEELLAPLGIDRHKLDVPPEALAKEVIGRTPETRDGWVDYVKQQMLRQKHLAVLFGVEFDVSDAEVNAHAQQIRPAGSQGPSAVSMRYAALVMIREDRINSARGAWMDKALKTADIRILDPRYRDVDLQGNAR